MARVTCGACGKEIDQQLVPGERCSCRCHDVRDVVVCDGSSHVGCIHAGGLD